MTELPEPEHTFTAHDLARLLLDGPDLPVIGSQPGDEFGDLYAASDIEDLDNAKWDDHWESRQGPALRIIYS